MEFYLKVRGFGRYSTIFIIVLLNLLDASFALRVLNWKPGDTIFYSFLAVPIQEKNSSTLVSFASCCGCDVADCDEEEKNSYCERTSLEVSNISEVGSNAHIEVSRVHAILKVNNKPLHAIVIDLSLNQINQLIAIYWNFLIDHVVTGFDDGPMKETLIKVVVDYKPIHVVEEFSKLLNHSTESLLNEPL